MLRALETGDSSWPSGSRPPLNLPLPPGGPIHADGGPVQPNPGLLCCALIACLLAPPFGQNCQQSASPPTPTNFFSNFLQFRVHRDKVPSRELHPGLPLILEGHLEVRGEWQMTMIQQSRSQQDQCQVWGPDPCHRPWAQAIPRFLPCPHLPISPPFPITLSLLPLPWKVCDLLPDAFPD